MIRQLEQFKGLIVLFLPRAIKDGKLYDGFKTSASLKIDRWSCLLSTDGLSGGFAHYFSTNHHIFGNTDGFACSTGTMLLFSSNCNSMYENPNF